MKFFDSACPVIIAGAPRSGTTFLTTTLNMHPQILITNELRAWSAFGDFQRRTSQPNQILPEHPLRDEFKSFMEAGFGNIFREFYRTLNYEADVGCARPSKHSKSNVIRAFGDKNPGYADANQPGCLDLIVRSMPDVKFIHIHRDPRSCVASYMQTAVYSSELERCIDIWLRHVMSMANLRDKLGSDRVLDISYEQFVTRAGEALFRRMESFLSLDQAASPIEFLERERKAPIPYRSPVTPLELLGQTNYTDNLNAREIEAIESRCRGFMHRYGYSVS
jgi:hypothetical protein